MVENFDYSKTPGKIRKRFYAPEVSTALVSIITPYYNAGKYFEETFNSVMNQTFPWFEWIIVNDGSTNEEDVKILEKFAKEDTRIRVINQENGGQSCARNTGVNNAKTDLVVPLDADDLIAPPYLEYLYWALQENPDAAWAYTDSYGFGTQEYVWKYPFNAERMKKENMLVATAMIRKKDFDDIGGYKIEKWRYNEDWRFWLEMLEQHKKPVHVSGELFWYRRHDTGMLTTLNNDEERNKFSENIIKEAAANVDTTVQSIEYPRRKTAYSFYKPKYTEWERKSNPTKIGKRVMWLIPWMVMGGADKFNLDAIAGLNKKGYENYVLTTLINDNDWKQKFEEYTDEIFCMADFMDPSRYIEFVAYFIQSRQIDVMVVTNSYDGYYMLPWLRMHFPELVIIDYIHMEEWYWKAGGHARASSAQNGISEKTFVCNSATRKVMTDIFDCDPERVECMYIGVDHNYYDRNKENAGYLHEKLNLDKQRPIVLFPCRIHEQKRPFMLLDIAEGVIKNVPDVAFVVVGDGPQLDELKETIHRKSLTRNIYCIGRSNDMRACYRDSKVTLICSLKEGLALTAYESCSMGVPVVSSDVGGQGDLIGNDVGALIPLQQSEEMDLNKREFPEAEVMEYVVNITKILTRPDLATKMSDNCRRKIEAGFSLEKMVEHFDCELRSLCTDTAAREKRHSISYALQQTPNFPADYYTMYCEYKRKEEECEEIWNTRTWLQSKLDEAYSKPDGSLIKIYKKIIGLPVVGKTLEKIIHNIVSFITRKKA